MYIDLSKWNGTINWAKVREHSETKEKINGIILRSTVKSGALDDKLIENYNGVLHFMSDVNEISVYKFSYAYDYISARMEARKTLQALKEKGIHFDFFYLDLEKGDKEYTKDTANAVILAYKDEFASQLISSKFALYFNYNYLINIIDTSWRNEHIWLARYNKYMGDVKGANVELWQYTSSGKVDGINGNVDLSKEVK